MGDVILLWHSLNRPYNYFGLDGSADDKQSVVIAIGIG